jgi:hypothetical protein
MYVRKALTNSRFLMARLHIDDLTTACSITQIRKTLQELPSGVFDAYEQTMKRICSQQKFDRQLAERALMWVFCSKAHGPLRMDELQHAIALIDITPRDDISAEDLPHPDIILSASAGLLIQEVDQQAFPSRILVRPVHYTASEFFAARVTDEFENGPYKLAVACVTYLSQNIFTFDFIRDRGPDRLCEDFPFLTCAQSHWGAHMCEISNSGSPLAIVPVSGNEAWHCGRTASVGHAHTMHQTN